MSSERTLPFTEAYSRIRMLDVCVYSTPEPGSSTAQSRRVASWPEGGGFLATWALAADSRREVRRLLALAMGVFDVVARLIELVCEDDEEAKGDEVAGRTGEKMPDEPLVRESLV